jgi:uncharacterized protein (TIGR01777 family)
MKILITGATGLVGKELGKLLVSQGHEVVAVSRNAKSARLRLPFLATSIIEWSGLDPLDHPDLNDVDGVIHLMGENIADGRWTSEMKKRLHNSRVESTRLLRESFERRERPLQFWIQGSAIGIYGNSDSRTATGSKEAAPIMDENSPAGSGFLADLCTEWEAALQSTVPTFESIRKVVLRTGVVISHQGGALEKMMNPLLAGVGGVVAGGDQRMSVIHLADLVGFIAFAVQNNSVSGVFNLVSKEPVSQRDFISQLADRLCIKTGLPVPAFGIRLAMGEMGDLLLRDQAVISQRMADSGYVFQYAGLMEILNEVAQWYLDPFSVESGKPEPAHLMYSEQFLPLPRDRVFEFFSDAKNLERITPDFLNFNIKSIDTDGIREHTKITYQLKLHGIPFGWLTDIAVWDPPHRFVDNQVKGPYRLWYHEHAFTDVPGGTLMRDWVRFRLPMGKAGMAGLPKVLGDVRRIFDYRTEIIDEILLQVTEKGQHN